MAVKVLRGSALGILKILCTSRRIHAGDVHAPTRKANGDVVFGNQARCSKHAFGDSLDAADRAANNLCQLGRAL